ncbi:hypothetical protein IWW34DRAFT_795246 [Fusarium oxysporum f. sp. albedinis]|nr:hypothetical protein IWW34DRAFT_795246 [Fusarium oxysporum f. sp. albedinis]
MSERQKEDAPIIELRGKGMKWEDISKRLPGRNAISCRLHYQNYLEKRSEWDERRKDRLAKLYERFEPEMWAKVAEEMAVPWRAAEAMHWQLGETDMARRAGVIPFSLASANDDRNNSNRNSPSRSDVQSHSQRSMPRGHGAPPPRVVYNRAPPKMHCIGWTYPGQFIKYALQAQPRDLSRQLPCYSYASLWFENESRLLFATSTYIPKMVTRDNVSGHTVYANC